MCTRDGSILAIIPDTLNRQRGACVRETRTRPFDGKSLLQSTSTPLWDRRPRHTRFGSYSRTNFPPGVRAVVKLGICHGAFATPAGEECCRVQQQPASTCGIDRDVVQHARCTWSGSTPCASSGVDRFGAADGTVMSSKPLCKASSSTLFHCFSQHPETNGSISALQLRFFNTRSRNVDPSRYSKKSCIHTQTHRRTVPRLTSPTAAYKRPLKG